MFTKISNFALIVTILFFSWSCEDKETNDTTPPTVMITYPVQGSTVSGQVVIVADADDNEAVDQVEFYVDEQLEFTDTGFPWEYIWDTDPIADWNQHSLYAKAYDGAGNTTSSSLVLVIVASISDTISDTDGNEYQTTMIGTQEWMIENLKVTHYRNGDSIATGYTNSEWPGLSTGAYAVYADNESNTDPYGYLYNWYAVDDNRSIAPSGWHVPTDDEWQTLINYLGGSSVAGGKLKEAGTTHWNNPNTGATNESGFTALPGGYRFNNGYYNYLGNYGDFWSSTENYSSDAWYRELNYYGSSATRNYYYKEGGFSIRCVRD